MAKKAKQISCQKTLKALGTENRALNDTELRPAIAVKAIKVNGFNSRIERQSYQIIPQIKENQLK